MLGLWPAVFFQGVAIAERMAKHPVKRRGRMGRYIRGAVDEELNLGTLAAKTLVSVDFDDVVSERAIITSLVAGYSLREFTPGAADGPIMVGVAHSDYVDAEMEAYIESTTSWKEADLIGQEIGKRKIRRIGIFQTPADALQAVRLNDGKEFKTKLNWILTSGQGLKLWAYNMGSSALATTAPVVSAQGHVNIFPK